MKYLSVLLFFVLFLSYIYCQSCNSSKDCPPNSNPCIFSVCEDSLCKYPGYPPSAGVNCTTKESDPGNPGNPGICDYGECLFVGPGGSCRSESDCVSIAYANCSKVICSGYICHHYPQNYDTECYIEDDVGYCNGGYCQTTNICNTPDKSKTCKTSVNVCDKYECVDDTHFCKLVPTNNGGICYGGGRCENGNCVPVGIKD
eukprot:TRINITY_DN2733_c0_g1_i1.p1 TRINITY_DN2733_c0_g1~~TRINITY_DN2733_c0_g1_i1.p1  ORF type:complete len:201 (-),score=44.04 TRINITY_DN2733_c0_g1_i1:235-837(-)